MTASTRKQIGYVRRYAVGFLLFAFLNGLIITTGYLYHLKQIDQAQRETAQLLRLAEQDLNHYLDYSIRELFHMKGEILQTDASPADVYTILVRRDDSGPDAIRYGWSNQHKELVAASSKGIYPSPIDLSSRDYVQHGSRFGGNIYISRQLKHIVTGRELIAVSLGVNNAADQYLGTIAAAINMSSIRENIEERLGMHLIDYLIVTPRRETLAANVSESQLANHLQQSQTPVWRFRVVGKTADQYLAHVAQHTALYVIGGLLLFNLIAFIAYRAVHQRILQPVSSAMQSLAAYVPADMMDDDATLEIKLKNLKMLASQWQQAQDRLQEQEQIIRDCVEALAHLHTQQERFLRASSQEMHRMFGSVRDYANHLEELIMHQQLQPDAAFDFDEVREMGENLQHLADCFQTLNQPHSSKTEMVDPCAMIRHHLSQMEDAIERRNMQVHLESAREVWMTLRDGQTLLDAIIRSTLSACIRHAEDESALHVRLLTEGEQVMIAYEVSRFRQQLLSANQQSFGMFVPSLERDMHDAIQQTITDHAHMLVAQSFMHQIDGTLNVDTLEGQSGFRITMMLHSLIGSAA